MSHRQRQQKVERKSTSFNVSVAAVRAIERMVAEGKVASRSDAADRALLMFLMANGESITDEREDVAA